MRGGVELGTVDGVGEEDGVALCGGLGYLVCCHELGTLVVLFDADDGQRRSEDVLVHVGDKNSEFGRCRRLMTVP